MSIAPYNPETAALDTIGPRRLGWGFALLIATCGAVVLGAGLGNRVLSRHEVLAAYPAKEMLSGGHWIVQMFAGIPRTLKPPTTGWLIAGGMAVFRSDAEWVTRLPAMISGILIALMTAAFAATQFGRRVGVLTGLIQLTCYYTLMQARLAEADMPLAAAVTAAMLCFGMGTLDPSSSRSWLLSTGFYAFTGLAFLLKGPNGLVFILGAVVLYTIIRRELHVMRFFNNPIGWVLFIVLLVAWPLTAYLRFPGIFSEWIREMRDTASGGFGRDSIFTYLVSIPAVLLPWTPAMALGIWAFVRMGFHRQPIGQFFACWFVPGFIYLHFIALKHKHYPIPLLPPFSILGAIGLIWYIRFQHTNLRPRRLASAIVLLGICATCVIAALVLPPSGHIRYIQPFAVPLAIGIALVGIIGTAAIYLEHLRKIDWQIGAIFAMVVGVICIANVWILPKFDSYRPLAEFARRAHAPLVPDGATIHIIDEAFEVEPHSAYYLRAPILRHRTPELFRQYAAKTIWESGEMYVVCIRAAQEELSPMFTADVLDECSRLRRRETEAQRFLLVRIRPRQG